LTAKPYYIIYPQKGLNLTKDTKIKLSLQSFFLTVTDSEIYLQVEFKFADLISLLEHPEVHVRIPMIAHQQGLDGMMYSFWGSFVLRGMRYRV